MRRLFGLALAVGLLPAASGGAVCVAHWVGGELHAQSGIDASVADDAHATHSAHLAPQHAAHEHAAHEHGAPASPGDPSSHETDAPCTALAACGALAAVESPGRPLPPVTPSFVVRTGQQLAPPGPASAPDVPPPRR